MDFQDDYSKTLNASFSDDFVEKLIVLHPFLNSDKERYSESEIRTLKRVLCSNAPSSCEILIGPKEVEDKTRSLIKSQNILEAKQEIEAGLKKFPGQLNLLIIATNVYRKSGDREKSLEYAELLITHHPENWKGYGRAAQDLVALKHFVEAQIKVLAGLEKLPNQVNLLIIATDVFRASGDREKSLEYAELLITHYPKNWNGFGRAAQDLVALKRFEEAQIKVQAGLEKLPNQINLTTIANEVYRASGDRDTSLEYAELLSTHHPENWKRYLRAP